MYRKLSLLLLVSIITLFSGCWVSAAAQIASAGKPNFDNDIRLMRFNSLPDHHLHYDDYLQYSPAVLMLGLKVCGYKGRSDWSRMLVSDAFSAAIMAASGNALKYSVKRMRPDGSRRNSFPSGHTATAFMLAGMLNHEYGWRSPWWGFAGYSVATVTSVARIFNNRHWASDTFAGALIGVGSTELGYFLSDLIFKDRHLYDGYEKPEFGYCSADNRYWSIQFGYKRRFVVAAGKTALAASEMPYRGSGMSLSAEFPLIAGSGFCVEGDMGSLLFKDGNSFNLYSGKVGMYWARDFAKVLEFQVQTLIGYAGHRNGGGIDLSAAASLNLVTGNNYKLRALAEWETLSWASREDSMGKPYLNSVLLGFNAAFFW